jgi:hypothetical protein
VSVDEENQKYARLCSEVRAAAEADLLAPLKDAGATPEAALKACADIAVTVALCCMEKDSDHRFFDEIGEVRKTLAELEGMLSRLSLAAKLIMQDRIWDEEEKTSELYSAAWLEIMLKHDTWQTFQRFRDALPKIVESLPTTPPRKGGHDDRIHRAVSSAMLNWWTATGRLPPATKTAAGEGTAPLFVFLQRQLKTPGISPDSFRRVRLELKRILDLPRGT